MILTLLSPLGQNYFQGPKLNVKKLETVAEFMECFVSTNSLQLPRCYIQSVETRQTPINSQFGYQYYFKPSPQACENIYY